jgi:tetratricopeptide (TPR) repeat protein
MLGAPQQQGAGEQDNGAQEKRAQERRRLRKRSAGGPYSEPESTAHLLRARTAYFREDYNRALDHILKAIIIEPENSQAYAMLGSLYYTINWKNLALKYWEKSLEIDPENQEVDELVAELKNR